MAVLSHYYIKITVDQNISDGPKGTALLFVVEPLYMVYSTVLLQ